MTDVTGSPQQSSYDDGEEQTDFLPITKPRVVPMFK